MFLQLDHNRNVPFGSDLHKRYKSNQKSQSSPCDLVILSTDLIRSLPSEELESGRNHTSPRQSNHPSPYKTDSLRLEPTAPGSHRCIRLLQWICRNKQLNTYVKALRVSTQTFCHCMTQAWGRGFGKLAMQACKSCSLPSCINWDAKTKTALGSPQNTSIRPDSLFYAPIGWRLPLPITQKAETKSCSWLKFFARLLIVCVCACWYSFHTRPFFYVLEQSTEQSSYCSFKNLEKVTCSCSFLPLQLPGFLKFAPQLWRSGIHDVRWQT